MNAEAIPESIPLDRAILCADCSVIYNMTRDACPDCASGAAMPLAMVLSDRSELIEGLRALSKLLAWAKRPAQNPKRTAPVGASTGERTTP